MLQISISNGYQTALIGHDGYTLHYYNVYPSIIIIIKIVKFIAVN